MSGPSTTSPGPRAEHLDREAFGRGEASALEAFFRGYFRRLYGLCYYLVGSRSRAEDLTQEVLLRVCRSTAQYDPARDPWPWVVTIAYNTFKDQMRSAGREQDLLRRGGDRAPEPRAGPDPHALAEDGEARSLLQQAVNRLPPEQRAVVLLRDYQGCSHVEISAIMGCDQAASRKRYSRAIATLGRQLRGRLS